MTVTFADYHAFRRVGAQAVGCDASVLAGVGRHRVHDLDGDDAVRVRDRILVRLQLLPALEPFDLKGNSKIRLRLSGTPNFKEGKSIISAHNYKLQVVTYPTC